MNNKRQSHDRFVDVEGARDERKAVDLGHSRCSQKGTTYLCPSEIGVLLDCIGLACIGTQSAPVYKN